MTESPEEILLKRLAKDPKYLEKVQKSAELDAFRQRHGVQRASPLRCPACSQYGQSGGTLWGPKEGTEDVFACKKCDLEFQVRCLTKSNEELMWEIRQTRK